MKHLNTQRYNIYESDFYRDAYARFNGAAAKLYLPKDIYNNELTSIICSDYKAHFQFDARV